MDGLVDEEKSGGFFEALDQSLELTSDLGARAIDEADERGTWRQEQRDHLGLQFALARKLGDIPDGGGLEDILRDRKLVG